MALNDGILHRRLQESFAKKAGDDIGGAMAAHLRAKAKSKAPAAATAKDRSEQRLAESLARVLSCAEAANSFFIEGNQKEALAALEDLLVESKATRQAIETHAERYPLEGSDIDDAGDEDGNDAVGEDGQDLDQDA